MSYEKAVEIDELEHHKPVRKTINGTEVLLIRDDDHVYASSADCPHKGAPLEDGVVCDSKLVCPWHKAVFEINTARLSEPPALKGLNKYPVEIRGSEVYVDCDTTLDTAKSRGNEEEEAKAHVVILGTGAAGAAALQTLLNNDFAGKITVVDEESASPYDRTMLTKAVAAGDMGIDEVPQLLAKESMEASNVSRLSARIEKVDSQHHKVHLNDGQSLVYDRLLVATGGIPSRPDWPGIGLDGIHTIRNLAQTDALIQDVTSQNSLTIVGNSFIALEAAASFKKRNSKLDIQVIAPDDTPFKAQFGEQIANYFKQLHEDNGIEFIKGKVTGFQGENKVEGVLLEDGSKLPTNLVLLATGITPVTGYLNGVKMARDGTVEVDAHLKAGQNIYAAGDMTSFTYRGKRIHIEHWRLAQQHGKLAAENILGADKTFTSVPYFWTQHYDKTFDYVGHADSYDDIETAGSLEDDQFIALFKKSGEVVAALLCGCSKATGKLIVALEKSADPGSASDLLTAA